MIETGYIKLYRVLLEKPIWLNSTPEQKSILIVLLLMANHKGKTWEWNCEKFNISPGQFVTSLDSIKKQCGKGISAQNIRTCLKRFKKLEFLTNESTKMGRIITIMNWGSYQPEQKKLTKDLTVASQSTNKALTPNKNVRMKECKKEKIKVPKKKTSFKTYLQEKIIENNFIETKDLIFEFYNYRMSMPAVKRYKSEKGINGLFRNLNECRKSGLIISECLEIAMEKGWLSFESSYFKNKGKLNGKNANFTGKDTRESVIPESMPDY